MTKRQPPAKQAGQPRPIRLTERDRQILETIYACDGMLSRRQIDQLFFSGQGRTQPRQRLYALFQHGYLNRPSADQIHRVPLGEHVYWLGPKGAAVVAGIYGMSLAALPWRKRPSLARIEHDLAVNDVRLAVTQACQASPLLELSEWVPEGMLRAGPDTVMITDRYGQERERRIIPDGFFVIQRQAQVRPDKTEAFAFLLEVDMATHTNRRFAREKVGAGVAYLGSRAYQERFGVAFGRWLVVTTSERRLAHLKHVTEQAGGAALFYFTILPQLSPETILTNSIWQRAGDEENHAIIPDARVISRLSD